MKKTKIVATIGPSSWAPEVLKQMIDSGMNVARINGAFADVDELKRVAGLVREQSDNVALMLDIKGHEVRLNKFAENIRIEKGQEFILGSSSEDPVYPATYPDLWKDISAGQILIMDKGSATLKVKHVENGKIYCEVINGNVIASGKGMNTPGAKLNNPPITKRDIEQLKFIVEDGWEYVAASFVRNANDIKLVREQLGNSPVRIIAKIEDQQGVDNIDEIITASDGIMIARGDMGSEMPFEKLPMIQKELIFKCNQAAKPVITATNMLESMIENVMPTRAEITDVANAVLDGTDALMTSGETTSGKYPVETMVTMSRIAEEAEKYINPELLESVGLDNYPVHVAMSNAAFEFTLELNNITKVLVYSHTGLTARLLARQNLPIPVVAFVQSDTLKRQLSLTKNVSAHMFHKEFTDRDQAVREMLDFARSVGAVSAEDKVLLLGNCNYSDKKKINYPNLFEYIELKNMF